MQNKYLCLLNLLGNILFPERKKEKKRTGFMILLKKNADLQIMFLDVSGSLFTAEDIF